MRLNWPKKGKTVPNYQRIAVFYDYLMRHVNYPRWFDYITEVFNRHLLHHRSVLEMACGTGIMLEKFAEAGWQVYGFDRSPEMVRVAYNRLRQIQHIAQVGIWVGDMRTFALRTPVDAVICLYDSLNYCLHEEDVEKTFACVFNSLNESGVFVFDVVTIRHCRRHFRHFTETDRYGEIEYFRNSYFDAAHSHQVNEFWISVDGERYYEKHVQRIYPLNTIEALLKKFQWEIIGVFDNFSRKPGTEKSDRVHYVVRKS